jgi:hypothetical protein
MMFFERYQRAPVAGACAPDLLKPPGHPNGQAVQLLLNGPSQRRLPWQQAKPRPAALAQALTLPTLTMLHHQVARLTGPLPHCTAHLGRHCPYRCYILATVLRRPILRG